MTTPATPDSKRLPVQPAEAFRETMNPAQAAINPTPAARPPSDPGSLAGWSFDDFEVLEEIGRGGMGIVYKALQKSLDRPVAIKMLPAEQFEDATRLARFQAEARIAAQLGHPNIVQVYQVGQCAAGHYFVMEYVDGDPVCDLLDKGQGNEGILWAVDLLATVAEAVHHAHTKGIVHRDLKPANIMIDRFRRPVVMDFGLAKSLAAATGWTMKGVIMGTPAYMAPEQTGERAEQVGPATDVYALGAILYTLLTGQPPYEGETPLSILFRLLAPEPPRPLRSLRADLPAELERICLKCLRKKAAERYSSGRDLAEDLRRFRAHPARVAAKPPAPTRPEVVLVAVGKGKEVPLHRRQTILGRAPNCHIVLKASDVSKQHCQVIVEPNEVVVEDLVSANGTFVNSQQVKRTQLQNDDELRIGDFVFQVRITKR